MKKIKIACGTLLLAALLGWNCPVWAAEPAALAAEAQQNVVVQTEQRITMEVLIKQVGSGADKTEEHYILANGQNGEELRLNFMDEGENAALLVDAQTGILTDWLNVQPGSRVMVNYSQQPNGNQLHYLLLNLGEEPPAGLFTVEDMAGLLESRILVDNGRLWVSLPKGVWQYPKEYNVLSLGVGHQVLLWYDEPEASQQPAQVVAVKMLHIYSPQEIEEMRQDKIRADMYYNNRQTRHLLVNGERLPDVVRYVHGEPYLPLRQTAEKLGFDVEWQETERAAYISRNGLRAKVVLYDGVYWLANGREQSYYGLPREYDNEICVPAELFEIFGADIAVDGQTMIVELK